MCPCASAIYVIGNSLDKMVLHTLSMLILVKYVRKLTPSKNVIACPLLTCHGILERELLTFGQGKNIT